MSPAPVAQSSFRSPRRYRTLRFRLTGKKPDRIAGWRERPVSVKLPPVAGVTPNEKPTVHIFLGTEPEQYRAERIFVWSVVKNRDPARAYEIHLMKDLAGFDRNNWWTGFTSYRYAIPDLAGRTGRAIYNDVDQIYFADPGDLFDLDMKGAAALAISDEESSVMLIDCARLATVWHEDEAHRIHSSTHFQKVAAQAGLWGTMPSGWNARDFEYVEGESMLLHYTTLYKQPWHPFPELFKYQHNDQGRYWLALEREADAAGFTVFTAEVPSPDFEALRGANAPGETKPLMSGDIVARHERRARRLADGAGAASLRTAAEVFPGVHRGDATRGPGADGILAIDFLDRLPEDDIPWVLAGLMQAAGKFVYIGVTAAAPVTVPGQPLAAGRPKLSAKWWRGQVEIASRCRPGIRVALVIEEAAGPLRQLLPETVHMFGEGSGRA